MKSLLRLMLAAGVFAATAGVLPHAWQSRLLPAQAARTPTKRIRESRQPTCTASCLCWVCQPQSSVVWGCVLSHVTSGNAAQAGSCRLRSRRSKIPERKFGFSQNNAGLQHCSGLLAPCNCFATSRKHSQTTGTCWVWLGALGFPCCPAILRSDCRLSCR